MNPSTHQREYALTFFLGISIGVLFTVIYMELSTLKPKSICVDSSMFRSLSISNVHFHDYMHRAENLPKSRVTAIGPIIFNDLDKLHSKGGDLVARQMAQKIRILCWVLTSPSTLRVKGQAVKDTWGKRCNILIFMSSKEDKEFPAVGLNIPEGRENLWLKTRAAWKYVYEKHRNDADWFIKGDDDSFVIVENLRLLVSKYDTNKPLYFGRWFKPFGGYNSGGAGYVFSLETLKRFYKILKDPSKCKLKSFAEDVEVGVCLRAAGVSPSDSRDELKRETFHPFAPEYHLIPGSITQDNWLYQYNRFPVVNGGNCCSDHTVTFHYISPPQMYILEYMVYHLHPYGVNHIELEAVKRISGFNKRGNVNGTRKSSTSR